MRDRHLTISAITSLLTMTVLAPLANADGTVVGVVKDRSTDYVLVQPADGAGRRHWLTAATGPNETPDPAVASATADVRTGDEVEVRYSGDQRRRVEAIKVVRRAAMVNAIAATRPALAPSSGTPGEGGGGGLPADKSRTALQQTPSLALPRDTGRGDQTQTASTQLSDSGTTVGERVNAAIDNALAVTGRITELPIWTLLAGVFVVGGIIAFISRRLDRSGHFTAAGRVRTTGRVIGVLVVALLIDRKLSRLQTEVDGLRAKVSGDALATIDKTAAGSPSVSRTRLVDTAASQQALAAHFKDITLRPSRYDAATDVVQLRFGDPQVSAYLAVVDLTHPGVRIKLGTDLTQKTLTSAFAKVNDCGLAINGEAGQSPAMNSRLGVWRGYLVDRGQVLSREDATIPRPFLGFDASNRAAIVPASSTDRTLPADKPTVIWGRLDSIVSGVVQTENARNRQPRTAMGVGQNGTRLYLLVVDGRQRGYSTGMTRAEVGYTLAAFGCDNAMLCDEGGSSCMYLRDLGGIVNVPSDNAGEERPTYTQFGISVVGGK